MRPVPLTRGYVAVVDDDDYMAISRFKWHAAVRDSGKTVYAATVMPDGSFTYLHRFLMNAAAGVMIDHKNGDGLDDRRSNLRRATRSENGRNRKSTSASSGVCGVHMDASRAHANKWRAYINLHGKRIHLGWYGTKEEAASARRTAATVLHGEFAGAA